MPWYMFLVSTFSAGQFFNGGFREIQYAFYLTSNGKEHKFLMGFFGVFYHLYINSKILVLS